LDSGILSKSSLSSSLAKKSLSLKKHVRIVISVVPAEPFVLVWGKRVRLNAMKAVVGSLPIGSVLKRFAEMVMTMTSPPLLQNCFNSTITITSSNMSLLDFANYYSNLIIAVLTIFLVALTASTVWQTRQTIGEMRKATRAQFLPHLKPSIGTITSMHIDLIVKNVGKGAAVSPLVRISLVEFKDSSRSWRWPMLVSDESVRLGIPTGSGRYEDSIDFFKKNQSTLDFHAEYDDILGQSYTVGERIDITAHVRQWESTLVKYQEDELKEIRRELERIAKELSSKRDRSTS